MIPIETFARDLWEAMRDEIRHQLGSSITPDLFAAQFPDWEHLSADTRQQKILITRDELLKVLDRAGYRVVRKESHD